MSMLTSAILSLSAPRPQQLCRGSIAPEPPAAPPPQGVCPESWEQTGRDGSEAKADGEEATTEANRDKRIAGEDGEHGHTEQEEKPHSQQELLAGGVLTFNRR